MSKVTVLMEALYTGNWSHALFGATVMSSTTQTNFFPFRAKNSMPSPASPGMVVASSVPTKPGNTSTSSPSVAVGISRMVFVAFELFFTSNGVLAAATLSGVSWARASVPFMVMPVMV